MKIEVRKNGQVIETLDLQEGTYKIGRASNCPIRLTSSGVSKQHALLVIKGNKAAIVDLGSSNGVFVNGILVKKQRVENNDEVGIADFKITIGGSRGGFAPPPRRGGGGQGDEMGMGMAMEGESMVAYDGNLAQQMAYQPAEVEQEEPETPPEKFISFLEEKVMMPYYSLVKSSDWRWILAVILLGTLVASVILSVIPVVRWGQSITTKESLGRAQTIISQAVRENTRILSKSNEYRGLTVEAIEAEDGIINAFIVDHKTKTVLAPVTLFDQDLGDNFARAAIKKVVDGEERVALKRGETNVYVVAQPIYLFHPETKQRNLSAVVLANFEVSTEISSTFEPMVEAVLFATLLSLGAFFFIFKMVTHPVQKMNDQLDAALKGESVAITCDAQFPELESLAQQMNFAVSKLKTEGISTDGLSTEDPEAEDANYISVVKQFDEATSDALLLLDTEKKVRYVGNILSEMVGMRNQYAEGQNISDACKDPGLAGTSIDLAESCINSLGATQFASMDLNGITRDVVAVGHKSSTGEQRMVLIVIKLGGGDE